METQQNRCYGMVAGLSKDNCNDTTVRTYTSIMFSGDLVYVTAFKLTQHMRKTIFFQPLQLFLVASLLLLLPLLIAGCHGRISGKLPDMAVKPVDSLATGETKALLLNLKKLSFDHFLFGQEDALAYGVGWRADTFRTDVHDISGAFPALFGWDISFLGRPYNIDSVDFGRMRKWMQMVYDKGGVNTVSMHMPNPVTGTNAWDTTRAVYAILPGGSRHDFFKAELDKVAAFFLGLKGSDGKPIPVIFRPWHEHTGSWFWWGEKSCTKEEYKALWHFTVSYLRDVKGVHNLLYAYSPDRFVTADKYLERFPGLNYIDILGFDDYGDFQQLNTAAAGVKQIRTVVELADSLVKVPALTETGLLGLKDSVWFTKSFLGPLEKDPVASRIAYMLVWRNVDGPRACAPFKGSSSINDFMNFRDDERSWFLEDLHKMYQQP